MQGEEKVCCERVIPKPAEPVSQWTRRLKKALLRSPRLRALARRWWVAPRQIRVLTRVAAQASTPPLSLGPETPPSDGPVVLILALRPWGIHRGWEGVLSRQLEGLGARVIWATCDGLLTRCDAMLPAFPESNLCSHCTRYNRGCASAVMVERVSLKDYLSLPESVLRQEYDRVGLDERLRKKTEASFQRLLGARRQEVDDLNEEDQAVWDELAWSAYLADHVAAPLLDAVQPDAMIAMNGKFFTESILIEHAARRDAAVWTYERGNVRDTIVLAPRRTAVPFDTDGILRDLEQLPLSGEQREVAAQYLSDRAHLGNGQVRFIEAGAALDLPPVLPEGRRVALFTNLIWDSGVVGEDTIFDSMFDWIATTIDQLATQPDTQLVIRVHPAEQRVYWHPTRDKVSDFLEERYPDGLPSGVVLVDALDQLDSYALMRASDLVLVYASSVGMEAAALGKPVIVAANSNYSRAPFVARPESKSDYLELLALSRPTKRSASDDAELALRFIYRLYFELMTPMPLVRETSTGFVSQPENSADEAVLLRETLERLLDSAKARSEVGA